MEWYMTERRYAKNVLIWFSFKKARLIIWTNSIAVSMNFNELTHERFLHIPIRWASISLLCIRSTLK